MAEAAFALQVAAVPVQMGKVLLVTSRRTRRWILPKGSVGKLTRPAAAAREAWEEAGVTGIIETKPLGRYHSWRVRKEQSGWVEVEAYWLAVTAQADEWPEQNERQRRWFAPDELPTVLAPEITGLILPRLT